MLFFLQVAAVIVPAVFAVFFLLLLVGPTLGGIVHGRRIILNPWHALFAALSLALTVTLAVTFGWVSAP